VLPDMRKQYNPESYSVSNKHVVYFHAICALSRAGSDSLNEDERKIADIPSWGKVREVMLDKINRYMVMNKHCRSILQATRRGMINIDRQADLSDLEKVSELIWVFSELIKSLDGEAGSALKKVQLYLNLKELAWEFFRFIEETFFMVSYPSEFIKKVKFVEKAEMKKKKEVMVLPQSKYGQLIRLRYLEMSKQHTPVFFHPGWDVGVYEALDRLRQLAYDKENAVSEKFFKFFGSTGSGKEEAGLIRDFIQEIQYQSPEKIVAALEHAKNDEALNQISGFVDAVDGANEEIKGIVKLLTNAAHADGDFSDAEESVGDSAEDSDELVEEEQELVESGMSLGYRSIEGVD